MALAQLSVHEVKVDRNLIHGIEQDPQLRLGSQRVVNTARSLGLVVYAVGAQCLKAMAMVRQIRCDPVQGGRFESDAGSQVAQPARQAGLEFPSTVRRTQQA